MSREAHVRFCERLRTLSSVDSTDDIDSAEAYSVAGWIYQRESAIHLARVYMGKKQ